MATKKPEMIDGEPVPDVKAATAGVPAAKPEDPRVTVECMVDADPLRIPVPFEYVHKAPGRKVKVTKPGKRGESDTEEERVIERNRDVSGPGLGDRLKMTAQHARMLGSDHFKVVG